MTADERSENAAASHGSTSRSLLADAQGADPEAWERLVHLYAPLVASWCRRWGVAEQDITDVLQDVFAAVFRHLERFRKEQSTDTFRGWLLAIARNKMRDHFRRRAQEPVAAGGTEASLRLRQALDPQGVCPEEGEEPGAFDAAILQALDAIRGEFQERTWQAFWQTTIEGQAAPDVARNLDMQAGTVRVAKSRVLTRLRRELGDLSQ